MKIVYGDPFVSSVVRLQYVNLAKPDEGHKFSRGNFNVTALLPKKDKKGFRQLMEAVAETAECEIDEVDNLEKHPLLDGKGNLRDGDDKKNSKKEGFPGHYIFITGSANPIECCKQDDDGEVVECDPKEIYSGCYAQLALQPAMYEEGEVTFFLQGVMKVDDGDRFTSGRTDTKQLFANWAGKGKKAEDGDEDEDEAPKKKKAAPVQDEDEDEAPKAKRGRPAKSSKFTDDEDEDEPVHSASNGKVKKKVAADEKEEETEEEPEEDEDEAPRRKRKSGNSMSALLDD